MELTLFTNNKKVLKAADLFNCLSLDRLFDITFNNVPFADEDMAIRHSKNEGNAWLVFHEHGNAIAALAVNIDDGKVYLNYVSVRDDMQGNGFAGRLLDSFFILCQIIKIRNIDISNVTPYAGYLKGSIVRRFQKFISA